MVAENKYSKQKLNKRNKKHSETSETNQQSNNGTAVIADYVSNSGVLFGNRLLSQQLQGSSLFCVHERWHLTFKFDPDMVKLVGPYAKYPDKSFFSLKLLPGYTNRQTVHRRTAHKLLYLDH